MNFRQRLARFMMGRYGTDQLNQFLFGISFLLIVLSMFRVPYVYILGLLILGYSYFRMFSK